MGIALSVNHSPGCWPEWQTSLLPSGKAGVLAFLLPCGHIANSLRGQNLFSFSIWSMLLFLMVLDKAPVGRLLPKYVWFSTVRMDFSVLPPEWLLLQVQQLEYPHVPWAVLAWGLWEKNKSNSSYLTATFVLCFGTQGTNSVPEYLTLFVKCTTFLDYS